jgi:hypothetical protein
MEVFAGTTSPSSTSGSKRRVQQVLRHDRKGPITDGGRMTGGFVA